jgi:cytochrome c oxidase assembly protein Cox11
MSGATPTSDRRRRAQRSSRLGLTAAAPGESAELPVSFFADPALAEDKDLDSVYTITLSDTFYPAEPAKTAAALGKARAF